MRCEYFCCFFPFLSFICLFVSLLGLCLCLCFLYILIGIALFGLEKRGRKQLEIEYLEVSRKDRKNGWLDFWGVQTWR